MSPHIHTIGSSIWRSFWNYSSEQTQWCWNYCYYLLLIHIYYQILIGTLILLCKSSSANLSNLWVCLIDSDSSSYALMTFHQWLQNTLNEFFCWWTFEAEVMICKTPPWWWAGMEDSTSVPTVPVNFSIQYHKKVLYIGKRDFLQKVYWSGQYIFMYGLYLQHHLLTQFHFIASAV